MKNEKTVQIRDLFDGMPEEILADIPVPESPGEWTEVSAEGVRERVDKALAAGGKPRKRGRTALRIVLIAAAAAMLLAGCVMIGIKHYRTPRVEVQEDFTTVGEDGKIYVFRGEKETDAQDSGSEDADDRSLTLITFDRDHEETERKTHVYGFRAGELPISISEGEASSILDYLAYSLRRPEDQPSESEEGIVVPLPYSELASEYGAALEELDGVYARAIAFDYQQVTDDNGYPIEGIRMLNIATYCGNLLNLPFMLNTKSDYEETTVGGHKAVCLSREMDFQEEKILLVYYEEEDTILMVSVCKEYDSVSLKELKEIAGKIVLVDSGVDAGALPKEFPVLILGTAR